MGTILYIHGMGHDTNQNYWRPWAEELIPYLVEQGLRASQIHFAGIYYYDLVPQPGDGWKKVTSVLRHDVFEELKKGLWEHIVRGGDLTELLSRGPIDGLINLVVDNFGDIFTYLLDDQVYERVNERFYQSLSQAPGPVTLIAYSLGSMISYCALQQQRDPAAKLNHLVTMGSPIFWFRKWLEHRTELDKRPTAARWTNLAGQIDVACPHLLGYQTCQPDTKIECKLERLNPVKGHLAYFTDPQALKELAQVIAKHWTQL